MAANAISRRAGSSAFPYLTDEIESLSTCRGLWNLDREFKSRLRNIRRDLRQTGEALVETQRARRKIDETMRTEPILFAGFDARVKNLSPKIDVLMTRVEMAMLNQRGFMQGIAVEELRAQRQRLDTYTIQARFALATIYDNSDTIVGVASQ